MQAPTSLFVDVSKKSIIEDATNTKIPRYLKRAAPPHNQPSFPTDLSTQGTSVTMTDPGKRRSAAELFDEAVSNLSNRSRLTQHARSCRIVLMRHRYVKRSSEKPHQRNAYRYQAHFQPRNLQVKKHLTGLRILLFLLGEPTTGYRSLFQQRGCFRHS